MKLPMLKGQEELMLFLKFGLGTLVILLFCTIITYILIPSKYRNKDVFRYFKTANIFDVEDAGAVQKLKLFRFFFIFTLSLASLFYLMVDIFGFFFLRVKYLTKSTHDENFLLPILQKREAKRCQI